MIFMTPLPRTEALSRSGTRLRTSGPQFSPGVANRGQRLLVDSALAVDRDGRNHMSREPEAKWERETLYLGRRGPLARTTGSFVTNSFRSQTNLATYTSKSRLK